MRILLCSLLFVLFGASLCYAGDDLSSLEGDFLRGKYTEVVARTQQLLDKKPVANVDRLLYLQGVSALKLQEFDLARSSLLKLVADHQDSRFAVQGWLALGQLYESSGQPEKAMEVYRRLLSDPKAKSYAPQVSLRMAEIQRAMGLSEEAWATLESVTQTSPQSPEAAQAKQLLQGEDFYYAVQVGAFTSSANAQRMKAELDRRGYETAISEAATPEKRFYRVRVGRFSKKQEAEEMATRLERDGFPGRVVP